MTALTPLPGQPSDTPWPTAEWPTGPLPTDADRSAIEALMAGAFDGAQDGPMGQTHAVVAIHRGRLVLERYGSGYGPDATCRSWSMAKSITQVLAGFAVTDGKLDIHAPADVAAWRTPGDPRGAITPDHLLRMSSGLEWNESYVAGGRSDVIEMLMGGGAKDMAGFAADKPLAHPPGEHFYYSSGSTNIVSRLIAQAVGATGEVAFLGFMRERLFAPLGMTSPAPRFDGAGTFVGSSFCFSTPRDFARFGLFCLRGGVWEGRRLLPEGWIDYGRTATWQQPGGEDEGPYGAHWWLDRWGPGSFAAAGYEGQRIILRPDIDLVLVRNGVTPYDTRDSIEAWTVALAAAFG